MSDEQEIDHLKQARFAAGFLVDGPGDVRNDGATAYAIVAQVHATIALADEVRQLRELLGNSYS